MFKQGAKKMLTGIEKSFSKRVCAQFQHCKTKEEILEKIAESLLHPDDLSNLSVQADLRNLYNYELVQLIQLAN